MNINNYIRMLRIGDWIKFYPFIPLIGAYLAGASPIEYFAIFAIFFLVIGYGFIVNNYYDVNIDSTHSGKVETNKNPLVAGTVSAYGTRTMMFWMIAAAILLSLMLNIIGTVFTVLTLLALAFYSGAGLRLKDVPFIDVLTHGFMFGFFPFLAGFTLADGAITPEIMLVTALFTLLGFEALLTHLITDYRDDVGHATTTATHIGVCASAIALTLIAVASVATLWAAVYVFDTHILIAAGATGYLIAYPLYMCKGEVFNAGNIRDNTRA